MQKRGVARKLKERTHSADITKERKKEVERYGNNRQYLHVKVFSKQADKKN